MNEAGWDDLQLFFHVATAGGLSGAASRTGLSAPTIGRRMLALERKLGRALFQRSQQGYRLAHDGETLLKHVGDMQRIADTITAWHGDAFALPFVSVAADGWIASYLAERILDIVPPQDNIRVCCNSAHAGVDLNFRGADIAVLGARPASGNLAVRRSVTVSYAAYAARSLNPGAADRWVSIGTANAFSAPDRWTFENREAYIHVWTTTPDMLLTLVRHGAGSGVLPVGVGDHDPALVRKGEIIAELDHALWIASNDDDRHRAEVRLVIDRISALLKADEARFAGRS